MFENYNKFSITKQFFLTKKIFDDIFQFIKNDFNDKKREIVFKITVVVLLKMIFSIVEAVVNQLNNKSLFIAIQTLKQSIKKIEKNTTCLKHKTNFVIIIIRFADFMKI